MGRTPLRLKENKAIRKEHDAFGEISRSTNPGGDSCGPDHLVPGDRPPRVLVIDDEAINVHLLRSILTRAGYTALTASDGESGRRVAREECPDIILLDIMMPGESGFETMELLGRDRLTMDIPVIFISALSDADHKVRGLTSGAVDYVTKPFERSEVLARIRLHLRLVQARRLLVRSQAERLEQLAQAQQAILPSPEDIPEAGFHVLYLPAQEAGGDFYDVYPSEGDSYSYFVADICGHDLAASFITSSLKALITQNSGPLYTPLETLKNINAVLRDILSEGKFLTAQLLRLDRRNRRAVLFSAGHPPPVHVSRNGEARFLNAQGDILGIFPSVFLTPLEMGVEEGDMIYLYTDGLVERFKPDGSFDRRLEDRLLKCCSRHAGRGAAESVLRIREELVEEGVRPYDDMVLMGIKV